MHIEFPPVDVKVEGLDRVAVPPMMRICQNFDAQTIGDLPARLREELKRLDLGDTLSGKRICITAGSRGIPQIQLIFRTLCDCLKEMGAEPFLIPAMGSHGGGSADGQRAILAGFGVTEASVGAPILSSMDVVAYGTLPDGTVLYCDKYAAEADGIILFNKIKPHTDFRGPHESGLAKMVAIGIANHKGAASFHQLGFARFAEMIPAAAEVFLKAFPVICGIGVVQNAYDKICALEAAPDMGIMELDRRLLAMAKERMAKFKFGKVDLLIIDEIGKNISGFGSDPNVTGRTNGLTEDFRGILDVNKVFIVGLTAQSHHNGSGLAAADLTTRRCLNGVDWMETWTNLVTSTQIGGAAIPMYMNNDRDAITLGLYCCSGADSANFRVARIRNTLCLEHIEVSSALYADVCGRTDVERLSDPAPMQFDADGFLLPME